MRSLRPLVAVTAAAIALFSGPAAGAVGSTDFTGDITPPALHSLSLSATTVDDSSSEALVYFTAHITDDYSGVDQSRSGVTVESPTGNSYGCVDSCGFQLQSGSDTDGVFQAKARVPQGSTPGTWTIFLFLLDNAGNQKNWNSSDLQSAGYPYEFTVTNSGGDATLPKLAGIQIETPTVDVSNADGVFDVQIHATDDNSGVGSAAAFLVDPKNTNGGSYPQSQYYNSTLVSGSASDGQWDAKLVIPQHTHAGTWSVGVVLIDKAGNVAQIQPSQVVQDGFPDTFQVNSPDPDNDAPHLVSFSMSPAAVDVHDSDQTVTVQAHITDNLTGVSLNTIAAAIQSPLTHQFDQAFSFQRTSGTSTDGTYQATVTIPRASETGAWPIGVAVNDKVANQATYGMWGGPSLATIGATPVEVVYNVPLPPLNVTANPGDASALIQWQPGDDQGSPIRQYTVNESPQGLTATVDASQTSVLMKGLQNGVAHSFQVVATNQAGPSNPSTATSATPQPGLAAPQPSSSPSSSSSSSSSSSTGTTGTGSSAGSGTASGGSGAPAAVAAPSGAGGTGAARYGVVTADGAWHDMASRQTYRAPTPPALGLVGGAADPAGPGGWAVGADGGIFTFGDARFLGSTGGMRLNRPIVGMAATPDGGGYWLVASDGGIFTFGDARFLGSTGALRLVRPIVGMATAPDGGGYWLVASDGGIFTFGDASFAGSTGASGATRPVVGIAVTPDGGGYWVLRQDGWVTGFGDATYTGPTPTGGAPAVTLARS